MPKIVVQSTDPKDTPADLSIKLEKALTAMKAQQEGRQFKDPYLRGIQEQTDKVVNKIWERMVSEIAAIITP